MFVSGFRDGLMGRCAELVHLVRGISYAVTCAGLSGSGQPHLGQRAWVNTQVNRLGSTGLGQQASEPAWVNASVH